MSLGDVLEKVDGPESFLEFLRALHQDRLVAEEHPFDIDGSGAAGWESHTIEQFLEAALRWAEDSGFGATQGLGDANPWYRCATLLYCGKIYE